MPKTSWFLGHARYKSYMLHEVSSLFVGLYIWLLIYGLFKLGSGPDAWADFIAFVKSPIVVILSLIAFAFFIMHTISWFQAVPQACAFSRASTSSPATSSSAPTMRRSARSPCSSSSWREWREMARSAKAIPGSCSRRAADHRAVLPVMLFVTNWRRRLGCSRRA